MIISERWLREWVRPRMDVETLAERLSAAGLVVDSISPAAPPLDGVVVGRIRRLREHPGADRLVVCDVDTGPHGRRQIVCGAPNAATGVRAPVALPGTRLPGGHQVAGTEIAGVESAGMLCSAAELGLEDEAEGLMLLDAGARPGRSLAAHLGLDDRLLDVELTPNRGDCLSVIGVTREVAAITGTPTRRRDVGRVAASSRVRREIRLDAPDGCPRYVGRIIEDIDPDARTPDWMRERLRRAGLRAISPVVDVTNYVMLELGQPMHAFDLSRLNGGIVVRESRPGERLLLLDGTDQELRPGTLLICDESRPLALAGVMGGERSGIGTATRNILFEAAFFAPDAIRATTRAYDLHTESGHRFERGVDPAGQVLATERATALLLEIAGGRPGPVLDSVDRSHMPERPAVHLRARRLDRLLGVEVPAREVRTHLQRLGMRATPLRDGWRVTPPSWRFDIEGEHDLVEEVARLHGYDRVPPTRPRPVVRAAPPQESRVPLSRLRNALNDRGYQEVVSFSFVDARKLRVLDPEIDPVPVSNPITSDMNVMRTTLWPGVLGVIAGNRNRQIRRVRVFETGRAFLRGAHDGEVREPRRIAGAATGPAYPESWSLSDREVDFFDIKGDVEALVMACGGGELTFEATAHPGLHPGQAASILHDGQPLGVLGTLHPDVQEYYELDQAVQLFELDLDLLRQRNVPRYRPVSRYPSIRRDLSVVVPESVPAWKVLETARRVAGDTVVDLRLFDVYRGEGIDSTEKSLAFGLTLQHSSRTLKDGEADKIMGSVVAALRDEVGAELRT